jgi:uncharacterized cupin superfamily protein
MAISYRTLPAMSDRHPNIINAQDIAWIDTAEVNRAASPGDRDRGHQFGARARPLGRNAGAGKLGCTLYELPPGKRSFPFHYHLANEEAIYILDGEATLRLGDREIAVHAGDYIALRVGPDHAHQLINNSGSAIHYLCMSTLQYPEIAMYPDSRKFGAISMSTEPGGAPFRQLHRLGESLPYYDGEDG